MTKYQKLKILTIYNIVKPTICEKHSNIKLDFTSYEENQTIVCPCKPADTMLGCSGWLPGRDYAGVLSGCWSISMRLQGQSKKIPPPILYDLLISRYDFTGSTHTALQLQ